MALSLIWGGAVAQDSLPLPPPPDSLGFWQPAQQPNTTRSRAVLWGYLGGTAVLYAYQGAVWYGPSGLQTPFRWFDDSQEWVQIDKVGHAYGSYHYARSTIDLVAWAGGSHRQQLIWGAVAGFGLQAPIELLDGFSPDYGASWSDIVANTAGVGLAVANHALWREQRVGIKFSFHTTRWPSQRPDLLGETTPEQILKDYNGQTYWLTLSPGAWLPPTSRLPRWLGLSVGYGGEGLIGGYSTEPREAIRAREYRQYYLGLDIDLTRFPVRSGALRSLFTTLNSIRLPLPALEWSARQQGVRFHWLYF